MTTRSSDRQAGWLGAVSRFTTEFGKSKPQTTNLWGCLCSVVPAFLHHCTLRYVNVMTGYHSHLVMRARLGKYRYCFHCRSVWLHCCTVPQMMVLMLYALTFNRLYFSLLACLHNCCLIVHSYVMWSDRRYLDPRQQQQPYAPSWPGFPRSPGSTLHSTAGATGPC